MATYFQAYQQMLLLDSKTLYSGQFFHKKHVHPKKGNLDLGIFYLTSTITKLCGW